MLVLCQTFEVDPVGEDSFLGLNPHVLDGVIILVAQQKPAKLVDKVLGKELYDKCPTFWLLGWLKMQAPNLRSLIPTTGSCIGPMLRSQS